MRWPWLPCWLCTTLLSVPWRCRDNITNINSSMLRKNCNSLIGLQQSNSTVEESTGQITLLAPLKCTIGTTFSAAGLASNCFLNDFSSQSFPHIAKSNSCIYSHISLHNSLAIPLALWSLPLRLSTLESEECCFICSHYRTKFVIFSVTATNSVSCWFLWANCAVLASDSVRDLISCWFLMANSAALSTDSPSKLSLSNKANLCFSERCLIA